MDLIKSLFLFFKDHAFCVYFHLCDLFLLRHDVPLTVELFLELDHFLDGDASSTQHELLDINSIVLYDLFYHIRNLDTFDGPREQVSGEHIEKSSGHLHLDLHRENLLGEVRHLIAWGMTGLLKVAEGINVSLVCKNVLNFEAFESVF